MLIQDPFVTKKWVKLCSNHQNTFRVTDSVTHPVSGLDVVSQLNQPVEIVRGAGSHLPQFLHRILTREFTWSQGELLKNLKNWNTTHSRTI